MSDVAAVLTANRAFYRAFAARDLEAMAALWASEAPVACVHPGWDALRDRAAILKSWRNILGNPGSPAVLCENETAHVLGDVAYVLCHEVIEDAYLVATNLFVRERGQWKLAHHQAGPLANPPEQPDRPPPRLQ
jgi:ketosteroid isomerase-like protein